MRIHKVLDDSAQVEERSYPLSTAKMALCENVMLDVLVVPLNGIVVVAETMFFAADGYAERELRHMGKELPPGRAIGGKPIAHKGDEVSLLHPFMTLVSVSFKHLPIAGALYLLKPSNIVVKRTLVHKRVCKNILCFLVDGVEVVPQLFSHMNDFLINMDSPFDGWLDLLAQRILKNPHICEPKY